MIDIKDISGKILLSVSIVEGCERVEELMKSDYLQLSWSSEKNDILPVGTYIEYKGEKFSLFEPYVPVQKDELEFTYTPQFQSRIMGWGKIPFFHYTETDGVISHREADWNLTDHPANFMAFVVKAILHETGEVWTYSVDSSLPASTALSFQSVDLFSALNQIAGAFETEWWVDKAKKIIHLSKASHGTPVTLEVSKNISAPSVTSGKEGYYTRFYAFGSTRNILQDYQGANVNNLVNKRLTLDPAKYPGGYKDIRDGLRAEEIFSKVLIFDDIYPSSKLVISDVRSRLMYSIDEKGDKIQIGTKDGNPVYDQYAIWYFQIPGFTFNNSTYSKDNPEGMKIPDKNPSVNFQTGALAGREFELHYYDTDDKLVNSDGLTFQAKAGDYEIKFIEENSLTLPMMTGLVPTDGDNIILFNIKMPAEYTASAYIDLEAALDKEIDRLSSDFNNYQFNSNQVEFYNNNPGLSLGRNVTYKNKGYSYSTRVIKLVTKLDYEKDCNQIITVGNEKVKGSIQEIKEEVVSANKNIDLLASINNMTSALQQSYSRTQQLMMDGFASIKNMWKFDPNDPNVIYSSYQVYSQKGVSAYGQSDSGGSGGSGVSSLYMLDDVNPSVRDAVAGSVLYKLTGDEWGAFNLTSALGTKVDKVAGKGLSSNDFSNTWLNKLKGIEEGANKYILKPATAALLGGIMVGNTLSVNAEGVLDYNLTKGKVEDVLTGNITSHHHDSFYYKKSEIDDLFEKVNIGTAASPVWAIRANYRLFSVDGVSAYGQSSGGASGGIYEEQLWTILGNNGLEQIAKNHLTTALSDYIDKTSSQDITGIKTFKNQIFIITSGLAPGISSTNGFMMNSMNYKDRPAFSMWPGGNRWLGMGIVGTDTIKFGATETYHSQFNPALKIKMLVNGTVESKGFIVSGQSGFLKANGDIDSTVYYHGGNSNNSKTNWNVLDLNVYGWIEFKTQNTGIKSLYTGAEFKANNNREVPAWVSNANITTTRNVIAGGDISADGKIYIGSAVVATQNWVNDQGFLTSHQSLVNYVDRTSNQDINGIKTFKNQIKSTYNSGSWLNGVKNAVLTCNYTGYGAILNAPIKSGRISLSTYPGSKFSSENNILYFGYVSNENIEAGTNAITQKMTWDAVSNTLTAGTFVGSFKRSGGTANQFLKADGSIDDTTYLTPQSLDNYVTLNTDQDITGIKTFVDNIVADGGIVTALDSIAQFKGSAIFESGIDLRTPDTKNPFIRFVLSANSQSTPIGTLGITLNNVLTYNKSIILGGDLDIKGRLDGRSVYSNGQSVATERWVNDQGYLTSHQPLHSLTIQKNGTTVGTYNPSQAKTINITIDADQDTKNTAGSTNTNSKIYLIGATTQASNPVTYSHDTAFVGADGFLYSGSAKVATESWVNGRGFLDETNYASILDNSYLKLTGGRVRGATTFGNYHENILIPLVVENTWNNKDTRGNGVGINFKHSTTNETAKHWSLRSVSLSSYSNITEFQLYSGWVDKVFLKVNSATGLIQATESSFAVSMIRDTSTAKHGLCFTNVAGDVVSYMGYHNTEKRLFLSAKNNSNWWVDEVGKYQLKIGINSLTYNTYEIIHKGNIGSQSVNYANTAGGLKSFVTSSTASTYINQYTKIASIRLTAQYANGQGVIALYGTGDGMTSMGAGILSIRVKQQAALGSTPYVSLYYTPTATGYYTSANFKAVVVSNTTTETLVEFYLQNPISHNNMSMRMLAGEVVTLYSSQGYIASLPAGTAVNCMSSLDNYVDRINPQQIGGQKEFKLPVKLNGLEIINPEAKIKAANGAELYSDDSNTPTWYSNADFDITGNVYAAKFITGGTSSQFLKANGDIDSTVYYHAGNSNRSGTDWTARNFMANGWVDFKLANTGIKSSYTDAEFKATGDREVPSWTSNANIITERNIFAQDIDAKGDIYMGKALVATQNWVSDQGFLTSHQSLVNYVDRTSNQDINGIKTFKNQIFIETSGPAPGISATNGFMMNDGTYKNRPAFSMYAGSIQRWLGMGIVDTDTIKFGASQQFHTEFMPSEKIKMLVNGTVTSTGFIVSGRNGFIKANGSVDDTAYLPTTGGTLSGDLTVLNILHGSGAMNIGNPSNPNYVNFVEDTKFLKKIFLNGGVTIDSAVTMSSGDFTATSTNMKVKSLETDYVLLNTPATTGTTQLLYSCQLTSGYRAGIGFFYSTSTSKGTIVSGRSSSGTTNNLSSTGIQWAHYGAISATGSISGNSSSDRRLKENIKLLKGASLIMKTLNFYEYDYKKWALDNDPGLVRHSYGMIYDEVIGTRLYNMACMQENGYGALNYISSNYINIIAASVKETIYRTDILENRMSDAESRIQALEKENKELKEIVSRLKAA